MTIFYDEFWKFKSFRFIRHAYVIIKLLVRRPEKWPRSWLSKMGGFSPFSPTAKVQPQLFVRWAGTFSKAFKTLPSSPTSNPYKGQNGQFSFLASVETSKMRHIPNSKLGHLNMIIWCLAHFWHHMKSMEALGAKSVTSPPSLCVILSDRAC